MRINWETPNSKSDFSCNWLRNSTDLNSLKSVTLLALIRLFYGTKKIQKKNMPHTKYLALISSNLPYIQIKASHLISRTIPPFGVQMTLYVCLPPMSQNILFFWLRYRTSIIAPYSSMMKIFIKNFISNENLMKIFIEKFNFWAPNFNF